jgi:hypothetical protein
MRKKQEVDYCNEVQNNGKLVNHQIMNIFTIPYKLVLILHQCELYHGSLIIFDKDNYKKQQIYLF